MSGLMSTLKWTATRLPVVGPLLRELRFLQQRAAHRRLIRCYERQYTSPASPRIDETPLLIGYFETGFGLGEQVRGLASALQAAGLPFSAYPYNSFTGRPRDEAPWASHYDVQRIHAINLLCMAPDQTVNARRIIGRRRFETSYNILVTPWELPRAPESWRHDLDFFDELWSTSNFAADSFRSIFSKPILVVPPCIVLDTNPASDRNKFALAAQKFYFLFSFDFNSRPQRKNPSAVVRAFESAFPDGQDDVRLIFKISGAHERFLREFGELEAAAERDHRITILRGAWPKADVLSLFASVDCYVSLHRSEGFGIGMAEAMALGKPVIATAFSGNTDFLTADTGYPVPYRLRSVGNDEYPHAAGNSWAEPDIAAAAQIMRKVVRSPDEARKKAVQGQAYIQRHYGPKPIGGRAAKRLREIMSTRRMAKPID